MGSVFSKPKMPPIPAPEPPPPPPQAPKPVSEDMKSVRDDARRKAAAKSGNRGTILTGELGEAQTGKTILG